MYLWNICCLEFVLYLVINFSPIFLLRIINKKYTIYIYIEYKLKLKLQYCNERRWTKSKNGKDQFSCWTGCPYKFPRTIKRLFPDGRAIYCLASLANRRILNTLHDGNEALYYKVSSPRYYMNSNPFFKHMKVNDLLIGWKKKFVIMFSSIFRGGNFDQFTYEWVCFISM